MRNKQVDDWISENMVLSDADKRQCIETAQHLVEIAIDVRKNGLLSIHAIHDKTPKMRDMFLQKALNLAIDGTMPPEELRKTLQHDFIEIYQNDKIYRSLN